MMTEQYDRAKEFCLTREALQDRRGLSLQSMLFTALLLFTFKPNHSLGCHRWTEYVKQHAPQTRSGRLSRQRSAGDYVYT